MGIWDIFTPDAGQKRRQWLNQNVDTPINKALSYYMGAGNSLPQALGLLADSNPISGLDRAGTQSQDIFAADKTPMERLTSTGNMLSETAGAGLGLLGAPAASKIGADVLTDVATRVSKNAKKAGNNVVESLNQRGPMPVLGSNGGNMFDDKTSGIRGYHGSPYSFDKFDINKIGSGEGAQVYGRGLYFAEAEDVAKHYRDNISSQALDGAKAVLQRVGGDVDVALADRIKGLSRLEERYSQGGMDDRLYQFMKNLGHGQIEQLKYYKNQGDFTKGNMYEVNINAKPDEFLDWDKAINEQPSLIQDLIKNRKNPETELSKIYDKKMAKDGTGEDIYDYLYGGYDDQITASNLLKDAGVKGVRYLDQNSRGKKYQIKLGIKGKPYETEPQYARSKQEANQIAKEYQDRGFETTIEDAGTRNYVVFDDRLVSIVKKYGIAGAASFYGVSEADISDAFKQNNSQSLLPKSTNRGLL